MQVTPRRRMAAAFITIGEQADCLGATAALESLCTSACDWPRGC